jgi:hypothetical protein
MPKLLTIAFLAALALAGALLAPAHGQVVGQSRPAAVHSPTTTTVITRDFAEE